MNKFFRYSLYYLNKKNLKINILCRDNKVQKKNFKIIVKENCNNKKIRFIKFDKNLSFKLKNFDIIAGPSGTMTYEAISSEPYLFIPIKE